MLFDVKLGIFELKWWIIFSNEVGDFPCINWWLPLDVYASSFPPRVAGTVNIRFSIDLNLF